MDVAALVPRPLITASGTGVDVLDAAVLFADITGYTRLAERLVARGRAGTELLLDTIDATFTDLIAVVHAFGGDVVRFGGDALFVVIQADDPDERVERAVSCAVGMQRAIGARDSVDVPGGRVRLRQSIAVHDGPITVGRWQGPWTEEVVFGRPITELLALEHAARAGEVVLSANAAARTARDVRHEDGLHVVTADTAAHAPRPRPGLAQHDAASWLPPRLVDALVAGVAPEHRSAAVAFIGIDGLDSIGGSTQRFADVLVPVLDAIGEVAERFGVVPLCTDVAGDGIAVLVTSGAVAGEGDDVERVVGAVRQVVAAANRVGTVARAGVNAGLVFRAIIGHPERRTLAALGDTTNIAARVMKATPPGSVWVTAEALEQAPGLTPAWSSIPLVTRGRRASVIVGEVGTSAPGGLSDRRPVEFRGRVRELDVLRRRLGAMSNGVTEVVGTVGIGKTRLVREALTSVARRWWLLDCTVDDVGEPYGAAERLLALLPEDGDGGRMARVQEDAGTNLREVDAQRDVMVEHLASKLVQRLGTEPRVVVDLADHLDPGSRLVFERLAASAAASLVIVHRGGGAITIPEHVEHVIVEVGALDSTDTRAVVVDASQVPLADSAITRLVSASRGNPGFAVRLATHGGSGELPASLTALLAGEVDRIPSRLRTVARGAALIGVEVDLDGLSATCDLAGETLRRSIGELASIMVPDGRDRWRFRDEALVQALVASTPVRQRREMAGRLAAHLDGRGLSVAELIRVARAWAMAENDHFTLLSASRAGAGAAAIGAADEAADMFGLAWNAGRRLKSRDVIDLAERWSDAASACGREEEVARALAEATTWATAERQVSLLIRRARSASRAARIRSALLLLGRADRILATMPAHESGRDLLAVAVAVERGRVELDRGRAAAAARAVRGVLAIADRLGATRETAMALALVDEIDTAQGNRSRGGVGRRAHAIAADLGDDLLAGGIACNLGLAADNAGDWSEAQTWYSVGEAHFRRAGSSWSVALVALNRSTILLELGDADGAHRTAVEAQRELAAAGLTAATWAASTHAARAARRRGAAADAVTSIRRGSERLREMGETELACFRDVTLVEVLLLEGRARAAVEQARAMVEECDAFGAGHLLPIMARRHLALALCAVGDDAAAATMIECALDAARRVSADGEVCLCLQAKSLVDLAGHRELDVSSRSELEALEERLGVSAYPWFRIVTDRAQVSRRRSPEGDAGP